MSWPHMEEARASLLNEEAADSSSLEAGFLRSPCGRRCATLFVWALALLGLLQVSALGGASGPCATIRPALWAAAVAFAAFTLLARGFFSCMARWFNYPQARASADVGCSERCSTIGAWLWLVTAFVCHAWSFVGGKKECRNWRNAEYHFLMMVVILVLAVVLPAIIFLFDSEHNKIAKDPERSARVWCRVTSEADKAKFRSLPGNVDLPRGFRCGVGSSKGNNCWISSLLQLLRGKPESGFVHDEECAAIRSMGVSAGVWPPSPEDITAAAESVAMVCRAVGRALVPAVVIFAGLRADLRQDIPGDPSAPTVHMFNPVGRHFDPLWPDQDQGAAEVELQPAASPSSGWERCAPEEGAAPP